MTKSILKDQSEKLQTRLAFIESEVARLEKEKSDEWSVIKDFRVDAIRAESGYARMKKLTSEINTLNGEKKTIVKKLNGKTQSNSAAAPK